MERNQEMRCEKKRLALMIKGIDYSIRRVNVSIDPS